MNVPALHTHGQGDRRNFASVVPLDEVRRTLAVLMEPGAVYEVRIFGTRHGVVSGYFTDPDKLAREAAMWSGKAPGVFITLNPVDPALLARANNRLMPRAQHTTGDADIRCRRWLLIDLDPRRPAGISSTEAEHEAALALAEEIRTWLIAQGFPADSIVIADSGNGAHVLLRIDLPNDAESTTLAKRCLQALDLRFSDSQVAVDLTTYNPARIAKLYGTLACKGDSTPDRPHRMTRLLKVPQPLAIVSRDLLEQLAALAPEEPKAARSGNSINRAPFALEPWIIEHGLGGSGSIPWQGGRKWILQVCPWNPEHTNRSAFILQFPSGAIAAGCLHNSCHGKNWHTLRDTVEPGWCGHRSGRQGQKGNFEDSEKNEYRKTGTEETASWTWEPPVPFDDFDLPTFPAATLPSWLRQFVEAEAHATQTPVDLAAMLGLSVCAAAVAKKVRVVIWAGYEEPLNLYIVVVLPPGERKSAVFRDTIAPLEEYEQEEVQRLSPGIAEAQARHKIIEGRLQKAQAAAAAAKPEEKDKLTREAVELAQELAKATVPAVPRLIADDTSPERLATLIRDQGGRMAVMSPEGDIFDIMAGRYSATGSPNFGVFLKGHAGDTLRVDRVGRPPEFVRDPALTMGLAVQPDVLQGLLAKPVFRGRGLLGRNWYSVPHSRMGARKIRPAPVPAPVKAAYRQHVRALATLPLKTGEDGNPVAHILRLTPDAQHELQKFAEWLEPQLAPTSTLGHITDWAGKLVGAVARLAGVLHMVQYAGKSQPWDTEIQLKTAQNAIRIGKEYLIPHAKTAYSIMGADRVAADAKHLLRWILTNRKETFTQREIHQALRGRFKRATDIEPPLTFLVEQGFLRVLEAEEKGGPGRKPSRTFAVNPFARAQFTQNTQNDPPAPQIEDCEENEYGSEGAGANDTQGVVEEGVL